jgi:arginase
MVSPRYRQTPPRVLIKAPSNLGLRPLRPGHEPGTWRAPEALTNAGLSEALAPARLIDLPRPVYESREQEGTRLRNGHAIRAFNLMLADAVFEAARASAFPIVVGGDCSILLGALAGVRQIAPVSLVHIDGHSDFRHPGNYDPSAELGSVAGMDLALATGRGEKLLTHWPHVPTPLVADEYVVQIGEREGREPHFAWPDVNDTAITRIDVFIAREIGREAVLGRARQTLDRAGLHYWVHLDLDVLDQAVMPAVDSPGSPGIDPDDLSFLLRELVSGTRCAGLDVTIFDPDLDPEGAHAGLTVSLLRQAFAGFTQADQH